MLPVGSIIFHDHISLITVHKDSDYFDMMKREAEKTDEIGHFILLVLFCKVLCQFRGIMSRLVFYNCQNL